MEIVHALRGPCVALKPSVVLMELLLYMPILQEETVYAGFDGQNPIGGMSVHECILSMVQQTSLFVLCHL